MSTVRSAMAQDFDEAIAVLQAQTWSRFEAASEDFERVSTSLQDENLSEDEKGRLQQELQQAQQTMASTAQQLGKAQGQVTQLAQQEQEADGYAQVVNLMTTVAGAASMLTGAIDSIVTNLENGTPTLEDHQIADRHIAAITGAINALASISPVAVWERK